MIDFVGKPASYLDRYTMKIKIAVIVLKMGPFRAVNKI